MNLRPLGKTSLFVSEIGLGCEGFLDQNLDFTRAVLGEAIDRGVNYMDLYAPNPDLHRRLGTVIREKNREFHIQAHLCSMWKDGQYQATRKLDEVKAAFQTTLRNLGTDHVSVGMIHYVDSDKTWEQVIDNGILDYAVSLKKAGVIDHIGLSSHNPLVAQRAIETGKIEVLMFSVNPCYDLLPGDEDVERLWAPESYEAPLLNLDPAREKLYETCNRMGIGITVMKAFGGGDLLTSDSPAGVALTANQCIHYALTRPAVACVLSGVRSREQLLQSLAYETADETEKDYAAALASFPKISWQGHCMYCGHCAPCPKKIDVAAVTKFLNLAKAQGFVPETVREHYKALDQKAGDCVQCGMCETRCPFGVAIRANMREAKTMFGN